MCSTKREPVNLDPVKPVLPRPGSLEAKLLKSITPSEQAAPLTDQMPGDQQVELIQQVNRLDEKIVVSVTKHFG